MAEVDEVTARVAALWRLQGETFLHRHHSLVVDDVARLRGAVVVSERSERDNGPANLLERLRSWDVAVVDRLRTMHAEHAEEVESAATLKAASRRGAVVDLTGPTVVVRQSDSASTCRECRREHEPDRLVHPFGDDKPPLCIACARRIAGFRTRSRR